MSEDTTKYMTNSGRETATNEIQRVFNLQQLNRFNIADTTARERKVTLNKLHKAFLHYRPRFKKSLYLDSGKHPSEVDLTEIYTVTSEIKHAKRNIRYWMSQHRVGTPLAFIGSSSYIKYEPKGVVLIISPWNFPVNLTIGPLVSAIAAGNTVILKPSEYMPYTARVLKELISELFDENEVALIEGGVETTTALLELPFNHIFFTGSPAVGKIVMAAAAKNLTSVTLELGGKSPTIIDETANISVAARRTAWGKFVNNGQICIAPDHIYVHESKFHEFIDEVKKYLLQFYGEDATKEPSYARIVNARHFDRLKQSLDEAITEGAEIEFGGKLKESDNFISPTIVSGISVDSTLMTDEIFGPILPVIKFSNMEEVLSEINAREKPLALYIFSGKRKNINHIISQTRAGGTSINHNAIQFYNHNLPFGGSNNSGIGKGHGRYGFQEFSNARGVYQQHIPGPLELLTPPYNKFKQCIIDFTIKWL